MNEAIIRKHNERVKPEDAVFFLGDFIFKGGKEGGGDTDLRKYRVNMGRSDAEIKDMRSRIENELFDVLTPDEREHFELDAALKRINKAMEGAK